MDVGSILGGHSFIFLNISINNKPVFFSEVVQFKNYMPTLFEVGDWLALAKQQ